MRKIKSKINDLIIFLKCFFFGHDDTIVTYYNPISGERDLGILCYRCKRPKISDWSYELYQEIENKEDKEKTKSNNIVKEIINDLSDRKGLHDEWDSIDEIIKKEIIDKWEKIVRIELMKNKESEVENE